jgi:hypothetical protein
MWITEGRAEPKRKSGKEIQRRGAWHGCRSMGVLRWQWRVSRAPDAIGTCGSIRNARRPKARGSEGTEPPWTLPGSPCPGAILENGLPGDGYQQGDGTAGVLQSDRLSAETA